MRKTCLFLLALSLCPIALPAQSEPTTSDAMQNRTPFEAATTMAGHDLNGDWKNVDVRTRGLVRIIIRNNVVHAYGSCQPTACDWGELQGQPFAPKVDKPGVSALMVSEVTKGVSVILTISLDPDGRLRVQSFDHFTDASRRLDYASIEYFTR